MERQPNELDNILHSCVTAMLDDGDDIATCLARYPQYEDQLLPLLLVIDRLRIAPKVQASPAFQRSANVRMRQLIRSRQPAPVRLRWQRWAWAVAIALVMMVGSGAFIQRSLPGDYLYPLRRQFEQTRYTLTPTYAAAARLNLYFATERVVDAESLSRMDRVQDVETALGEYRWLLTDAFRVIQAPVVPRSDQVAFLDLFSQTRTTTSPRLEYIAQRHRSIAPIISDVAGYTRTIDSALTTFLIQMGDLVPTPMPPTSTPQPPTPTRSLIEQSLLHAQTVEAIQAMTPTARVPVSPIPAQENPLGEPPSKYPTPTPRVEQATAISPSSLRPPPALADAGGNRQQARSTREPERVIPSPAAPIEEDAPSPVPEP